ncbi:S8 family serine peptidase [Eubacteriaceae bacterium ES3]|nr:S8 family serine peptidase [Eubacteriaceae bacterium ES3]
MKKLLSLILIPVLIGMFFPAITLANFESDTLMIQSLDEINDIRVDSQISDQIVIIYKDSASISDLALTTNEVKAGESLGVQVDLIEVADSQNADELVDRLADNPNILAVEKNSTITASALPDDPDLPQEWQFERVGADKTWNQVENRDAVVVAVIDTGVNINHQDLVGRTVTGYDYINGTTTAIDIAGHGTMVAGCIVATANNATGIAGIAGNANILVAPYRVGGKEEGDFQLDVGYICAALYDAASRDDVRVINMSFGGYGVTTVLRTAIAHAANAGKVLVASAGNEGGNENYSGEMAVPASYNNVISVAATDINNQTASFSQHNSLVDLSAPGKNVYTTTTDGGYEGVNGTSFSSPIVAGACAVLLAQNPELSPSEVETILKDTALDFGEPGRDDYFGYGMIQLDQALQQVMPYTPLAIDTFEIDQQPDISLGTAITLSTLVSGGSAPYTYSFYYELDGEKFLIQPFSEYASVVFTPMNTGIYTLWVQVLDAQGLLVQQSIDNFVVKAPESVSVVYRTHVQNEGWQNYVNDGAISGTVGKSLRLEALQIETLTDNYDLGIQYRTHVENLGWQDFVQNDELSGTVGDGLRLEAVEISLTGEDANLFDVYYQVQVENLGWLDYAQNGESAGSEGYGYRLEAVRIEILPKGSASPGDTGKAFLISLN